MLQNLGLQLKCASGCWDSINLCSIAFSINGWIITLYEMKQAIHPLKWGLDVGNCSFNIFPFDAVTKNFTLYRRFLSRPSLNRSTLSLIYPSHSIIVEKIASPVKLNLLIGR